MFFDKKSRRALQRDLGKRVVGLLAHLLDTYLVLDGEMVITVGHRYKRIRRGA